MNVKVGEITVEARFDAALRAAEGWRAQAAFYRGRRRQARLEHARRMERIAERFVEVA